ncbi:MAG: GNAT family N-acetyltransferase [Pseudomonadota bacterium]
MGRVPDGYHITRADNDEVATLVEIDLAASQLFAPTGLIAEADLLEHVPETVFGDAITMGHLFSLRDHRGAPVGFALTSVRGETLYLDQISVHPDHGRKGLGAALVSRVVDDAKDRGLKTVALSTFRDLPWNGPFYRKLGFKEIRPDKLDPWMVELEKIQAETLDVSKRCFMRKKLGWW